MGRSPIRIEHFRIGWLRQAAKDSFTRALVTWAMARDGDGAEPTHVRSRYVLSVASSAGSGSLADVHPSPAEGDPPPPPPCGLHVLTPAGGPCR